MEGKEWIQGTWSGTEVLPVSVEEFANFPEPNLP